VLDALMPRAREGFWAPQAMGWWAHWCDLAGHEGLTPGELKNSSLSSAVDSGGGAALMTTRLRVADWRLPRRVVGIASAAWVVIRCSPLLFPVGLQWACWRRMA